MPNNGQSIDVAQYFKNGDILTELYTGQRAMVTDGKILFPKYENKIAIIKKQNEN